MARNFLFLGTHVVVWIDLYFVLLGRRVILIEECSSSFCDSRDPAKLCYPRVDYD